jgi:hypothetical protein
MKYKVVTNRDIFYLEDTINRLLQSGWVLQGGISISKEQEGFIGHMYAQALTKVNP